MPCRFIFDTIFYMKHVANKTKSASKSALPKARVSSKTANEKIVKISPKKAQREKVSNVSARVKTILNKNTGKDKNAVKNIVTKPEKKKFLHEDKPLKKAISKKVDKTVVSVKKNDSRIKNKTSKIKAESKSKISKIQEPVKTQKPTPPKTLNKKKGGSNIKLKAGEQKKISQKTTSKENAGIKSKNSGKQISGVKKSTKTIVGKNKSPKVFDKKSKPGSQILEKTKATKTSAFSESGKSAEPTSKKLKVETKSLKSEIKKVVNKKSARVAKPNISLKTMPTIKKALTKAHPEKKSPASKKAQNKTGKTAEKVLAKKIEKTKSQKASKPLSAKKNAPISKNKAAKRVSVKKVSKEKKLAKSVSVEVKKPRKKPVRPISSAVFRGKKSQYDFKVFSIDEKFEPLQAVYIISRRITDRRKRGHHKLICIGQTDSVSEGIQMHKKGKCIRQNEANVICLLKEENEINRLRIEADLREAHSVICNRQ